nr:hypothetical protein Q903MT_gene1457 [Picea sitchensis]
MNTILAGLHIYISMGRPSLYSTCEMIGCGTTIDAKARTCSDIRIRTGITMPIVVREANHEEPHYLDERLHAMLICHSP